MERPATLGDVHREVEAAEQRAEKVVERTTAHFDQRLKDSEAKLTWRMVATVGVGSILSGFTAAYFGGGEPVKQAVSLLLPFV